jgi:hypothetical protein
VQSSKEDKKPVTTKLPRGRHRKETSPLPDWVTMIKTISVLTAAAGAVVAIIKAITALVGVIGEVIATL